MEVPESLRSAPKMPITSGDKSWRLLFGPYDIYNIEERTGQAMMTPLKSQFYATKAFEFLIRDDLGNQWTCWCEYRDREYWEPLLSCAFQEGRSAQMSWTLDDRIVLYRGQQIAIGDYFGSEGAKPRRISRVVAHTFSLEGRIVGLVDISGMPGHEIVWLHPEISDGGRMVMAAASSAIILKHRKWYEERTSRILGPLE